MSAGEPPITGLARGLRLGRAALEAGAGGMLGRFGADMGAKPRGAQAGRVLVKALFELRGAALKIAQFLSLEEDLLPEGVARELSRACHRVPPMGAEFAKARVRAQMGPIDQHFSAFDPVPFAAASLGQVHAATLLDGREVAVKVQYPGMSETVRSDLRLLRRASNLLPHRAHYRRLLDEIETRLLEECDYGQEADALNWFASRLTVDGVRVAELVAPLSGPSVLCTLRLPGVHLDDWLLGQPGQAERDRAGQRLYDAFVQSLHVLGRLHADPNPGNVLFGPAGQIGLLDFGCTRWIPPDCQRLVARIWRAAVQGDDEAAHEVYRDMGLFAHMSPQQAWQVDRDVLAPFRNWVATPFLTERFDFAAQADFVSEGRRLFVRMLKEEALVGIRAEFVLVNRTLYGLYRLFERLGARIRCQTAWTSG